MCGWKCLMLRAQHHHCSWHYSVAMNVLCKFISIIETVYILGLPSLGVIRPCQKLFWLDTVIMYKKPLYICCSSLYIQISFAHKKIQNDLMPIAEKFSQNSKFLPFRNLIQEKHMICWEGLSSTSCSNMLEARTQCKISRNWD